MSKNNKHTLILDANIKALNSRLNEAEKKLDGLASKAGKGITINGKLGGGFDISSLVSGLGGGLARFAGPGGIAAAAAVAMKKLADHVTGLSKELRVTSNEVGLTVEELQRMQGVFSGTSLTVEKLGDMHKDLSEKMGAAILEGGGVSDMIKAAGLEFKELHAILQNGGDATDVLARVYYNMKKGGRTIDEIRAVMEDLVSDGSKLIPTFKELGSEMKYLEEKEKQQISITSDMAKKHEEYEKKSKDLSKAIDEIKLETLSGLVPIMTDILNGITSFIRQAKYELKMNHSFDLPKFGKGTDLYNKQLAIMQSQNRDTAWKRTLADNKGPINTGENEYLKKMAIDGRTYQKAHNNAAYIALEMQRQNIAAGEFKYNYNRAEDRNNFRFKLGGMTYDGNGMAVIDVTPTTPGKDTASKTCNKCGGNEHPKGQKCPVDVAKDAQRLHEQTQKKREEALKKLNALDVKLQGQTAASIASQNKQLEESLKDLDEGVKLGLISQQEAAEKRQALIDQNSDNVYKMLLGADPVDALNALARLQEIRDNELASHKRLLDEKLISLEDYHRRVNDTEQNYSQIGDMAQGLYGAKSDELSNSFDYQSQNDPFSAFAALDIEKAQAIREHQEKMREIALIQNATERNKQKEKLNEAHQKRMHDIDRRYSEARLGVASDMYDGIAGAMALFGAENSKAAKAAFLAHQSFQIGEATVSTYAGAANAIAKQDYAGAALIVAQGLAQVAKIKSVSVDGMAHDGIDNIPREGTWLLQKGERVVDDRTNGDLKEFLSAQKSGNSSTAPIEVHAPLHIAGNVNSADKMVMDAIKRHARVVAQAVEDAQRRKM
ncbi:hypothetical protein KLY11_000657 [Salmonella enterica]|nr:hypothetical protein [Salmonella enterica]